jgi:isopenicillin-N N-acyltransferase-like protein
MSSSGARTLRVIELAGAPRELGRAFGELCRAEIAELYRRRTENALRQARELGGRSAREDDLLALARACLEPTRAHHPDGFEELEGIAEGSGLALERVVAMNGLTDLRDVLAFAGDPDAAGGCTSCVVMGDETRDGRVLCAQTWDLATDNLPFVVGVRRRPRAGPATACITAVGCLSIAGLNEAGIAAGTTNLRTRDGRPGVLYTSVVHKALACERLEDAVAAAADAPRAAAHFFWLADGAGRAAVVECAATRHRRRDLARGHHVQCNHCLEPEIAALEVDVPRASSHARQARLEALLGDARGRVDEAALRGFLADRENGALAICRDDCDGISTLAAVVISPQAGAVHASPGLPTKGEARGDVRTWTDL